MLVSLEITGEQQKSYAEQHQYSSSIRLASDPSAVRASCWLTISLSRRSLFSPHCFNPPLLQYFEFCLIALLSPSPLPSSSKLDAPLQPALTMLFPEEDAPLLKNWIVKRIEDTSDADSEVLAEYIIALLKHEGTKDEVRKLCEAEIPDFLTEDPKVFLDDVFKVIAWKSYVPGAAPPPPQRAQAWQAQEQEQHQGEQFGGSGGGWNGNGASRGSRKRGYRDFDAPAEERYPSNDYRPAKNVRFNAPEPMHIDRNPNAHPPQPMPAQSFEMQEQMQRFMDMNMQMQQNWPHVFQDQGHGGRRKKNRRCRDFDTKGYCARGAECKFEHGHSGNFLPPMGNVVEGTTTPLRESVM